MDTCACFSLLFFNFFLCHFIYFFPGGRSEHGYPRSHGTPLKGTTKEHNGETDLGIKALSRSLKNYSTHFRSDIYSQYTKLKDEYMTICDVANLCPGQADSSINPKDPSSYPATHPTQGQQYSQKPGHPQQPQPNVQSQQSIVLCLYILQLVGSQFKLS